MVVSGERSGKVAGKQKRRERRSCRSGYTKRDSAERKFAESGVENGAERRKGKSEGDVGTVCGKIGMRRRRPWG